MKVSLKRRLNVFPKLRRRLSSVKWTLLLVKTAMFFLCASQNNCPGFSVSFGGAGGGPSVLGQPGPSGGSPSAVAGGSPSAVAGGSPPAAGGSPSAVAGGSPPAAGGSPSAAAGGPPP